MKIIPQTYIEVQNVEHAWAVRLEECTDSMKPVKPLFIEVGNDTNTVFLVVDQTLLSTKPFKIIDGVNGGISDDYKQVGFWKINYKS